MGKRILLFLLTNVMVIATISIVTSLLGLNRYLSAEGINYQSLAVFCAIWGTGGAFISLLMSKWVAKSSMGVQVIDPQRPSAQDKSILDLVHNLCKKAGLTTMPEVGIYDSPELNAFATGPSKNNSLVAISSGLLANMDQAEVEGVLSHEISHITNGDMVTMTLIQGIINSFALFLSRIIAYVISIGLSKNENQQNTQSVPMLFYVLSMVFDVLFTLLGSIVVAAFSRHREYRADHDGAMLVGKNKMISALQRLQSMVEVVDKRAPSLAALKISQKSGFMNLFSSHPPLEDRIARLQQLPA